MRFFSLLICTLSVFLTTGMIAQASENKGSEGSIQELINPSASVTTSNINSRHVESTALTKLPEEQKFVQTAALDSGQESHLKSSASKQKAQAVPEEKVEVSAAATPHTFLSQQNIQAVPEEKVEVSAEVTPKTPVAAMPEAEGLRSNKGVTELSTPNSKQPVSEEALNKNSSLSAVPSPQSGTEITKISDLRQTQKNPVLSKAEALRPNQPIAQSLSNNASQLRADAKSEAPANCVAQGIQPSESGSGSRTNQLAQGVSGRCPRPQPVAPLVPPKVDDEYGASPALSIYIPVGFGADRNTFFLTGSYQNTVRRDDGDVGAGGIGVGLGDAQKALGVELSYALETTDDSFGEGGFNAKVHRLLGRDASIAAGWNGFLNIGRNDFEQSKYGVITKVFRTKDSLDEAFSRVAVTVGVGDGQFRSNGAVAVGDNNINVFGNVAVRVVRPVSFIAEWTGQDLGLGLSIAPFRNFPFVITPAVRDLAGGGEDPRFVVGAGMAVRF
ncbi:MAG TPA: hypothetical protein DCP31_40425 [Cyanobacteria bacterium UBA8543]|nr:hypothetical protein [Cyanobacteria bacterium UBA8543]